LPDFQRRRCLLRRWHVDLDVVVLDFRRYVCAPQRRRTDVRAAADEPRHTAA
jgi:hypothetical protein